MPRVIEYLTQPKKLPFVAPEDSKMAKRGLNGRHRDQDGAISQKRSDTLVRTLRKAYGVDFLSDFRSDATLGTVLKKTGAGSLSDLVKGPRKA